MTKEKRKGYSTTEQQNAANQRYREKNRERTRYLNARSTARSFIKTKATKEDLAELLKLIEESTNKK